jgi:putative ABC transport system ATP-binding protein
MSKPEPAVVARDVHKAFDGGVVQALTGMDLTVERGEYVALTGPSGCGKSTLLHLIAALDRPTSGTITVDGQDVTRLRRPATFRRDRVGLVFQLHNLLPQLTAAQNVEVAMFGTGRPRRERSERAHALLAQVDLAGRELRTPPKLSGGERQRVAIARALANEPSLLLADEPTGNLDSAAVHRIVDLLVELRSQQPDLSILLVTHDPSVAAGADRIVHMRDGKAVTASMAGRG